MGPAVVQWGKKSTAAARVGVAAGVGSGAAMVAVVGPAQELAYAMDAAIKGGGALLVDAAA